MSNNNYQQQQQNNSSDKPNYVNTKCANLFNNKSGALQLGYASAGFGRANAQINLAAVFSDMRGRQAHKGQQSYDYDNGIFASLNAEDVHVLKRVLQAFNANKFRDIELTFRQIIIRFIDASLANDETMDNGVLMYACKNDGKGEHDYTHSFYFENITVSGYENADENAEAKSITINPSFDTFCDFIDGMCKALVYPLDHRPLRADPSQANSGKSYSPQAPSRRGAATAQQWANSGNADNGQAAQAEYNEAEAEDLPF